MYGDVAANRDVFAIRPQIAKKSRKNFVRYGKCVYFVEDWRIGRWSCPNTTFYMEIENVKFSLKIFMINKFYFAFKNKSNKEIIDEIKTNHINCIHANEESYEIVKPSMEFYEIDDFAFYTYCYNQPKDQNYWKKFLPADLVKDQKFNILEFSFVLFIIHRNNIYCTIGGSGINVIKKFIDPYFGIDLYQHFAKPNEDTPIVVNTRGVTGNLTERSNTFNTVQSINDSLEYSEIPKKLKIVIRDDLKNSIFKKYNFGKEMAIMEVGSYFLLRKKIDFEELKQLVSDIHSIRQDKTNYTHLTLFNKIVEESLINNLDEELKNKIVEDIILHNNPKSLYLLNSEIIEMVNTHKIEKFYECNSFKLRMRKSRKDKIIYNKYNLYLECTKYIYQNIDDINDKFLIKGKLFELNITGSIDEKEVTFGTFYSHINAEITLLGKKYFRIDSQWFGLDDKFIEQIKQESINYYKEYKLEKNILNVWDKSVDEDEYNKSHNTNNFYILDKVIRENIELCDILYVDDFDLYLIHVKQGFNTQMRSLSNQVILSAKRLWHDLSNSSGSKYFVETLKLYNSRNPHNEINVSSLYNSIIENNIKINFVMAYNNTSMKGKTSIEKLEQSESNIARFSLVQTVKEIQNYRNYNIKIIDISEL